MTKIQNSKQDETLRLSNVKEVLNLEFNALNLFEIWYFEFVIFVICITVLHLIDFFRALNFQFLLCNY